MATKKSEIIITANGKQAEAVIAAIRERMATLAQTESNLKNATKALRDANKADTEEYKKLEQELKRVQREMKQLADVESREEQNMKKVDKAVQNLATHTTRQLREALRAGKKELEHMSAANKDLEPLRSKLAVIQRQIERNTASVKSHSSAWQIAVKNITAYVGVFGAFNMLKSKLEEITRLSLKFSDQLADVRKVSGLEIEDINQLAVNLSKIDTRTSLSTLVGNLAYSGAKLGFGEMGIAGLESYVKAANQVNVALGEELGEEAMPALSKITENMGLIKEMGVEKAMLATGSAIFKLASTSTASAGPIVEFSKRLLSLGKNAGLTTPQILALASASDSFMLMPEVASTAMGKLIVALQMNHNLIEQQLGMAKGTINEYYQQGKMMDAILEVFRKMREKGGLNALGPVFKDLGSNGQRLMNTLVTMSEQLPTLEKHLKTSNDAFNEASAVTAEYNIQQATAEGIMQRANNLWEKAFVNPAGVDMVKSMAQAWYDLSKSLTQGQGWITSFQLALKSFYSVLTVIIRLAPAAIFGALVRAITFVGPAAGAAVKGLFGVTLALIGNKAAADRLTASWNNLSKAMKANIYAFAIGLAIEGLMMLFDKLKKSTDKAAESMDDFKGDLSELRIEWRKGLIELDRYRAAIDGATMGTKQRAAAINVFNKQFGAYLKNMLNEKSTALDVAKAYVEVAKALRAKMALQLKEKDMEKHVTPRVGWAVERREEYDKLVKGTPLSPYNGEWLYGFVQDARAKGMEDPKKIAEQLNKQVFKINDTAYNYVIETINSGSTQFERLTKNGVNVKDLDPKAKQLWAAMRYVLQDTAAEVYRLRVNRKYAPEQKTMDEYLAAELEDKSFGDLENEKPDKAAIAAQRKAQLDQNKEWRQQLAESEQEAKAIIDNIKNFYERQITEALNIATETGMNKELQDQMVNSITTRMNNALSQARKAIVGTKNDWDAFKKTLQADMIEPLVDGTNESLQLLEKIENNNLVALRRQIAILSKSLNKPEGALLDQVWKNATLNEKANARMENKEQQRRRQAILENDYTGKVNEDYQTEMEQFGFAMLTPEQMAEIRKGGEDARKFLDERTREWQYMFERARQNMNEIMTYDVSTESGKRGLFDLLLGEDWRNDAANAAIDIQGILQLSQDDFELFVQKIIEYNDAYVEAQKRAYDRAKKIHDNLFANRADILSIDETERQLSSAIRKQEREAGEPRTVAQRMGFADIAENDPELVRLALLEKRQWEYYEHMRQLREQDKISEAQLQEAREKYEDAENARLDRYAEKIKERAQLLEQTMKPVEEFGKALGDALSKDDADERADAVKEAVKSMVQSIGEQTNAMIREWMLQLVKKKLYAKLMAQEERKSQKNITTIAQEEGETRLDTTSVIETGIAAITQQAAQQITSTKQEQAAANATTTAAEAEGNVAAGVASGAAKTIGQLGWWGIPLVAVITALLNGLLAFALGKLFGGSKKGTETANNTNVKLASGMLTYDSGNVQQVKMTGEKPLTTLKPLRTLKTLKTLKSEDSPEIVIGRETTQYLMLHRPDIVEKIVSTQTAIKDSKSPKDPKDLKDIKDSKDLKALKDFTPILAQDGSIYYTQNVENVKTGLVTQPISTTINGQPSVIAERGPEIVIGRETTRAIMLSQPDILREIIQIDKNRSGRSFRMMDAGNVATTVSMPNNNEEDIRITAQMAETLQVLTPAIMALTSQLQKPIRAEINKYGRGGLIEEVQSGMKFMKKYQ